MTSPIALIAALISFILCLIFFWISLSLFQKQKQSFYIRVCEALMYLLGFSTSILVVMSFFL